MRHAQTEYNKKGIIQGSEVDSDINKAGDNQSSLFYDYYKSIPFESMAYLLAHAEKITKLSSICMICGGYAYFSQRLTDDKSQILVGESEEYEARCRKCFKP